MNVARRGKRFEERGRIGSKGVGRLWSGSFYCNFGGNMRVSDFSGTRFERQLCENTRENSSPRQRHRVLLCTYGAWDGPGVREFIEYCINSLACTSNATYPFELLLLKLMNATDSILFLPYREQLPLLQSRHHRHPTNKWRPTIYHIGSTHSELPLSRIHGLGLHNSRVIYYSGSCYTL